MSLKDSVYKRLVYSKSNNKEIMIGVVIDTVNEELFISLLQSYQERLEKSIKNSYFVHGLVKGLRYKCHKVNFKRGRP